MKATTYMLGWLSALLLIFAAATLHGCGSGEEDDTQSSSSATTELTQCDFVISEPQLEAVLEDVEEAGDEAVIEELGSVPAIDNGGIDQQTRLYKVTIIGCNNQVSTDDDVVNSDDDVNTSVGAPLE